MALSINNQFSTTPGVSFARTEYARSIQKTPSRESHAAGFRDQPRTPRIDPKDDSIQISEVAMWFSRLESDAPAAHRGHENGSSIRSGLVNSIRSLIESGAYDTTQRMDAAADAMIESL